MTVEDTFDSTDTLSISDITTLFHEEEKKDQVTKPEIYQSFKILKPSTHSLWSHVLWNASKVLTNHLSTLDLTFKTIIELGSGTGLPLISIYGNNTCIATDYPDKEVLDIIRLNADNNLPCPHTFIVKGLVWGDLKAMKEIVDGYGKADLIVMSDLIFNYSQHKALMKTAQGLLKKGGYILKTFSHHLPQHKARDLGFFEVAREMGFESLLLYTEKWKEMFPEDGGDLETRQTVYCYKLWLK